MRPATVLFVAVPLIAVLVAGFVMLAPDGEPVPVGPKTPSPAPTDDPPETDPGLERVTGEVVDEDGEPVPAAFVYLLAPGDPLIPTGPPRRVTTDVEGAFTVARAAGEVADLVAFAPGRRPVLAEAVAAGSAHRLVLPRGGVVRGRVTDDAGRPIVGARVTARTTGSEISPRQGIYLPNHETLPLTYARTLSGLGGKFTITGVGDEPVDVVAAKRGYPELLRECREVAPGSGEVELVLLRPFVATLDVVDADSNVPIAHASVKLEMEGREEEPFYGMTDLDGRFRRRLDFPAARAPDAAVHVRVYSEDYGEDAADGVPLARLEEDAGFSIALVKRDPVSLRIKLVYDTGDPYRSWAQFRVKPAAGQEGWRWARVEKDGYALLELRPGNYEYIRAQLQGGAIGGGLENLWLRPGAELERTITVVRGGDLDIQLVVPDDVQIRGGRAELKVGESVQVRGIWNSRFGFLDVPPGDGTLTITHDDYETVERRITVLKAEKLELEIPLKKK